MLQREFSNYKGLKTASPMKRQKVSDEQEV